MSSSALPHFPAFDPDQTGDVTVRWRRWVSRFKNLMVAMNITSDPRQKALLLHYAGESMSDIFDTLNVAAAGPDQTNTDWAMQAFTMYFAPQENKDFEVMNFRRAKQEKNEDLASFVTRLKKLSVTCGFVNTDNEIKAQILARGSNSKLRSKMLLPDNQNWTLSQVVAQGRAIEQSKLQAEALEKALQQEEQHSLNKLEAQKKVKKPQSFGGKKCFGCGNNWPHIKGRIGCPIFG